MVFAVLLAVGALPAPYGAATPAAAQVDPTTVAALELRGATTGMIVGIVHEGELALLDTYGAPTAESADALDPEAIFPFPWGTQMLVGVIARAVAAGEALALDVPLSTYLEELEGRPLGEATLEHLLEERAGLPDVVPPAGMSWSQLVDRAGDLELVAPPGAVYSRSRLSYPLAVRVLERVVGLPFNELASAAVLGPLSMNHSSFSPVTASETGQLMQGYQVVADTARPVRHLLDASGLPILYTSAPDLLALAVTWMSGGLQGAEPVLPPRGDAVVLQDRRFADGLWMEAERTPPRAWSNDEGLGFGANLTLYPETRSAVVVVGNGRLPTGMVSWALTEMEDGLLGGGDEAGGAAEIEMSGDARTGEEASELPPLPADLADWTGAFVNGGLRLQVALNTDGLPLLVEGEARLPLFRIGVDRWALPGQDGAIPLRLVRVAGEPALYSGGIVYRKVEG